MSKLTVYDMKGASVGAVELPDAMLETTRGSQAVHDAVVAHLANRRAGTACTKTKSEVAGSNKKPWKQKGTGRARAGLRQSPVWRGGAVVFGPRPRDFGQKINKKVGRLAFLRAFSDKVAAGHVKVLDALSVSEAKTRAMSALLKALGIEGRALFVVDQIDSNLALASRNLPGVEVASGKSVNVYQLLRYPTVVVSKPGMAQIVERLGSGAKGAA